MTAMLTVRVDDFARAASLVDNVADVVAMAGQQLAGRLGETAGMAGSDPGGVSWGSTYDRAAARALTAAEATANGCYRLASMFAQSARNYAAAESASGGAQPDVVAGLPWDSTIALPIDIGSAVGPGTTNTPPGWWLIHHTVGYVWPGGHQDRLRAAGDAWSASAAQLNGCATDVMIAAALFAQDALPEVDDMLSVCHEVYEQITGLAEVQRNLADACRQLAVHLDDAHRQVSDALVDLVEQSAIIQGLGALASVITIGTAEAPTQAVQAERIAAAAARVNAIIATFVELASAAAATVARLAERADRIAGEMLRLQDIRLTTAVVMSARVTLPAALLREMPALRHLVHEAEGVPDLFVPTSQLQRKYKHAKVFGVTGNYNLANNKLYRLRLDEFVADPRTVRVSAMRGRFSREPAILSYNPSSRIIVIQHPDGRFWSCWKMEKDQLRRVRRFGHIGRPH